MLLFLCEGRDWVLPTTGLTNRCGEFSVPLPGVAYLAIPVGAPGFQSFSGPKGHPTMFRSVAISPYGGLLLGCHAPIHSSVHELGISLHKGKQRLGLLRSNTRSQHMSCRRYHSSSVWGRPLRRKKAKRTNTMTQPRLLIVIIIVHKSFRSVMLQLPLVFSLGNFHSFLGTSLL